VPQIGHPQIGRRKIGLLGGTFDPPHLGHITVATDVSRALALDEIWLVPVSTPPHKTAGPVTSANQRLQLLRALVEEWARGHSLTEGSAPVRVCDIEIARGGVSYSVDTLRALTTDYPNHEFFLIMGVDQFLTLATWRTPEEIGRLATVVVMGRHGAEPQRIAPGTSVRGVPVEVTRVDVSSTEVRERVGQGTDVTSLVGRRVAGLIREWGLYGG